MSAEFWWTVGSTLALVIFNAGVVYQMIKSKPSKEKVSEMIDEKFDDHCPFSEKIVNLETGQAKNVESVIHIKSKVDQIDFNVQNICENFGVQYIGKKNGG
jgi:hypothetical protein